MLQRKKIRLGCQKLISTLSRGKEGEKKSKFGYLSHNLCQRFSHFFAILWKSGDRFPKNVVTTDPNFLCLQH